MVHNRCTAKEAITIINKTVLFYTKILLCGTSHYHATTASHTYLMSSGTYQVR